MMLMRATERGEVVLKERVVAVTLATRRKSADDMISCVEVVMSMDMRSLIEAFEMRLMAF